jgi:hypothetical protein
MVMASEMMCGSCAPIGSSRSCIKAATTATAERDVHIEDGNDEQRALSEPLAVGRPALSPGVC